MGSRPSEPTYTPPVTHSASLQRFTVANLEKVVPKPLRKPPQASLRLPAWHDRRASYDPELVEQLRLWDAKLAASGLEDVERRTKSGFISRHMPRCAAEMARSYKPDQEAFYRLIGQWAAEKHPTSRWGARQQAADEAARALRTESRAWKKRHAQLRRAQRRWTRGSAVWEAERDRRILRRVADGVAYDEIQRVMRVPKSRIAAVVEREGAAAVAAAQDRIAGDHQPQRAAATPRRGDPTVDGFGD